MWASVVVACGLDSLGACGIFLDFLIWFLTGRKLFYNVVLVSVHASTLGESGA